MLSNHIKAKTSAIIQKLRYNYIPPSCYNISDKVNPVLRLTLGNANANLFTMNIRVNISLITAF